MKATKAQLAMAKVFRRAANEFLSADGTSGWMTTQFAVIEAGGDSAERFLLRLEAGGLIEDTIRGIATRQGLRFFWLHFVAEGLERGMIDL